MPHDEPMLTTQQVAHRIGKSVRTVHRAIDAGELVPAMRAGDNDNSPYLFTPAEVRRAFPNLPPTTQGEPAELGDGGPAGFAPVSGRASPPP